MYYVKGNFSIGDNCYYKLLYSPLFNIIKSMYNKQQKQHFNIRMVTVL
jgi:hypothetical protein